MLVGSDAELYCGAWQGVYKIANFAGFEAITTSAHRVSGVTQAQGHLFWLDKLSNSAGNSQAEVWWLDDSRAPVMVGAAAVGAFGPRGIYADEPRNRLRWAESGLAKFSLDSSSWSVWQATDFGSIGSAQDEAYFYWTRSAPSFGTVERVRVDAP